MVRHPAQSEESALHMQWVWTVNPLCQSCQAHSSYSVLSLRYPDLDYIDSGQIQVSFSVWSHVNQGLISAQNNKQLIISQLEKNTHTHKNPQQQKKTTIQQIPQNAFFFLTIRKTLILKSWKNPPFNCYFLSFFHWTFSWIYFLLPVLTLQSFCKILCGYVSPTYIAGTTLCMRLESHQERKSCQSLEIL